MHTAIHTTLSEALPTLHGPATAASHRAGRPIFDRRLGVADLYLDEATLTPHTGFAPLQAH